ncbi:MAG: ABC transporter ATP-binding protein [Candidatus Methylomirabilis sp.]
MATVETTQANGDTPAAVRVRGVHKGFGEGQTRIPVLKGVDLDVALGEILLLVGPSGSGKTTLLSVIAGILDSDGGALNVLGSSIPELSPDAKTQFRKQNLGFIFQQYNLLPTLTAAENAAVPLIIRGLPRLQAIARATEVLHEVGLEDRIDFLPAKLSGGQQQRVAIARALAGEPRLILCDEPTANLDGESGRKAMDLLRRVGKRPDRAMIVVTHDSRIFEFADRIAHMEDGRIEHVKQNHRRDHS